MTAAAGAPAPDTARGPGSAPNGPSGPDARSPSPPGQAWLVPLGMLAVFAALCAVVAQVDGDADLWGRMAYARDASAQGRLVLPTDVYSYTAPGADWVDHEWGFNWVVWGVHQAAGWPGLRLLRLVLFGATALLALRSLMTARARGAPKLVLFALLAYPLALGFYGPRAQAFTFLCFAWMLLCFHRSWERGPRWILLGMVPFPLWVNLHGGFLAGAGMAGLWGIARMVQAWRERDGATARWLLAAGGWSVLGLFTSPWGARFAPFVLKSATIDRPFIPEWDAPDLLSPQGALTLLLAALGVLRFRERARRVPDSIALWLVAVVALQHQRHLPFLAIAVGTLAVPSLLAWPWLRERSRAPAASEGGWSRPVGIAVALGLGVAFAAVVGFGTVTFAHVRRPAPREPLFPAAAVDVLLARGHEGGLLVDFDWAQYALFRAWPQVKVAFDGRYEEVYPFDVYRRYFAWHYGLEGWESLPADPLTRLALVKAGSPRDERLSRLEGWTEIHRDPLAVLYARGAPAR